MGQFGLVFGADGRRLDEGAGETASAVRSEWVVHGEHDAIGAQDIEDLSHHTVTEHSTGGGVDVSGDVVEDPSFKVSGFRERIGSVREGDEQLSPMAEDNRQVGMVVEGSGEDQP